MNKEKDMSGVVNLQDTVTDPGNLRLRLEKCPKCSYERRAGDDGFASPYECPKCGVVYALAMEEIRRLDKGRALQDEAEVAALRQQTHDQGVGGAQVGGAMFVGRQRSLAWILWIGILMAVAALVWFL